MEKEIKKNENSLKKVRKHIKAALEWEFKNSGLILEYMLKREKILEKTQERLYKMNKKHFVFWWETQNALIS